MAKKPAPKKQKRPTKKQVASCVMTREEFERTDPLLIAAALQNDEHMARGFPSALRPLTDKEVAEMSYHILSDSVGAAYRLLAEVKRLRALVKP